MFFRRRAVSPIQEVLTIPHAVVPVSLGNDPDFMESEELPGAIQETALHVRSDSESRGSPSLGSKLHRRSSRQSDFVRPVILMITST